ncbi:hypothetical protein [Ottowia sp.]|uniref:hypothetical protein n=1 Tax=Ottowia sp. TaxID=1898956 RepID=UPI003A89E057
MTFIVHPPRGWRAHATAVCMGAALLLGACASPSSTPSASAVAGTSGLAMQAPTISVPPTSVGTWQELGYFQAPWLAGDAPVPVNGATALTRVAGLRRDDGHWLAIVVVQQAPGAVAECPAVNELHIAELGRPGNGCLRARVDADFDGWLKQQHSVLYQWLDGRGWTSRPRAWISTRVPDAAGGALESHVLVDTRLMEPTTRNNIDFLTGGQPAIAWVMRFAAATRAADGGVLQVPPFPFAPSLVAAPAVPEAAPPAASAPAKAEQVSPSPVVTPRPPAPAARSDRQ